MSRSVTTVDGVVGADEVTRVSLRALRPNPTNPRGEIDPADPGIKELAASIDQVGLLEPLIVAPDDANDPSDRDSWLYNVIAGHRRLAALLTLPKDRRVWSEGVLAVLRPDLAAGKAGRVTAAALVENLQRVDLSPLEEARAYHELKVTHGWQQAEIAEAVAKNQGHVSKRLALLKLLPELQARVTSGSLVLEQAVEAARLPKPAQEHVVSELNRGRPADVAIRESLTRVALAVERGRLIKDLKDAGVPVIDGAEAPAAPEGAVQVSSTLWWLDEGDHEKCKHRLVWFRAEPQAWRDSPAERWTIEYCTATDPVAAHPRDDSRDSVGSSPPGETKAQKTARAAEEKARRQATVDADEDRARRAEFMTGLLAGKLPKGSADHIARQLVVDVIAGIELYDGSGLAGPAGALLGRFDVEDTHGSIFAACDLADGKASGDELLRWALALRFAVDESALAGVATYYVESAPAPAAHLRFLASVGLELSSREEAFIQAAGKHALQAAAISFDALPAPPADDEPEVAGEPAIAEDPVLGGEPMPGPGVEDVDKATRDLSPGPVDEAIADVEEAVAAELVPLPDDLHALGRPALVDLAKGRGVATSPKMTKAEIRAALEAKV